jgi:hypothetical protein
MKTKIFILLFLFKFSLNSQKLSYSQIYHKVDSLMVGKSNLFLGENAHEDQVIQELNSQLIIKMIEGKKYKSLIWESNFLDCFIANKFLAKDSIRKAMKGVIVIWRTKEIENMYRIIAKNPEFNTYGVDIQSSSNLFTNWFADLIQSKGIIEFKDFKTIDSTLCVNQFKSNKTVIRDKNKLISYYSSMKEHLPKILDSNSVDYMFINYGLQTRIQLIEFICKNTMYQRIRIRDSFMAINLIWLEQHTKSNRIIWAHNAHNSYLPIGSWYVMGSLLSDRFKDRSINIAVSSPAKWNILKGRIVSNNKFPKKSIEYQYLTSNVNFVELKKYQNQKVLNRTNAGWVKSQISKQFDYLIILEESQFVEQLKIKSYD